MKKRAFSFVTFLATLALAVPLYAQGLHQAPDTTFYDNPMLDRGDTATISPDTKMQDDTGLTKVTSAKNLLGLPVIAKDGDRVGKIDNLKLDPSNGRIDYVVVDRRGITGEEHNYTPVPLGAIEITGNSARLLVDKSRLDNVPNPTDIPARQFRQDLNAHYGVAPTWEIQRTQ